MEEEKVMLRFESIESPWLKESIRSLRNKLLIDNQHHKVFCFSSLYPEEGVSTIVRLLAFYLSDVEKNVIIVSADLKNVYSEISTATYTLKDYLSNRCSRENIVISVNEHFKIIAGSNSNEDYSDLLHLDTFADLIKQLKNEYDLVLIDAPSFSVASEAIILSRLADSLILVVKENNVKIDDFSEFSRKLQKQNITIKGVVLNRICETENLEIKAI
ncbi:MAG: CpsD/CapB family tyrosine-protein kinase [Erysipelotrichaceae bacterium]|nr:CpsD/CapB family tyrosine-protein kinase [Erysipelotrichaceae bacterium]